MSPLLLLTLCAAIGNSLALQQLLGTAPPADIARKLAYATSGVVVAATPGSWMIHRYLLQPFGLELLHDFITIVVTAAIATVAALMLHKLAPLPQRLRDYALPLLIANGSVLGIALIADHQADTFSGALVYCVATAAGFALLSLSFPALLARIATSEVPQPFRGSSLVLVTASLVALALMGLAGLV